MKELDLTNSSRKALVDDDIWLRFCEYKWRVKKSQDKTYIARSKTVKGKHITIFLHREVLECPPDKQGHHLNSDTYDNRRENLKTVDPFEHAVESGKKTNNKSKDDLPF